MRRFRLQFGSPSVKSSWHWSRFCKAASLAAWRRRRGGRFAVPSSGRPSPASASLHDGAELEPGADHVLSAANPAGIAGDLGIIGAGPSDESLECAGNAAIGDAAAAIYRPEQGALGQPGAANPVLDQLDGISGQESGRALAC